MNKTMPLFICENCGCIENTALCSECTPLEFSDGSIAGTGKWHNRFPKEKFDPSKHNCEDYLNCKNVKPL